MAEEFERMNDEATRKAFAETDGVALIHESHLDFKKHSPQPSASSLRATPFNTETSWSNGIARGKD